jgi:hypothetical protein
MLSSSSPIFALSNHTTCSQTQAGAIVTLTLARDELSKYIINKIEHYHICCLICRGLEECVTHYHTPLYTGPYK